MANKKATRATPRKAQTPKRKYFINYLNIILLDNS